MQLTLKVDVDTYNGMRDGVPNLLKLFKELGIKASFFIPFGPDESGKAVFRIFRKKGFLKKMFRTNALKLYGLKTILRGTLLPAPMIGSSFPNIALRILDEGHELGIHGYNHVLWQDHLLQMNESDVRKQFELGIAAYEKIIGENPKSFAAPAWLCTPLSLKMLDEYKFTYASDTREGKCPFYPVMDDTPFKTIQIPSTLPTADEMLVWENMNALNMHTQLTAIMKGSNLENHVHTIHTEVEGTALYDPFSKWVRQIQNSGTHFTTLGQIAQNSFSQSVKIPSCNVILKELPGRSGVVSCQE